eukprot:30676-Chlamydomonas_euryale.AAC.6
MFLSHSQSSAPVSVTIHPAEGPPFTVQRNPDLHAFGRRLREIGWTDGCRGGASRAAVSRRVRQWV